MNDNELVLLAKEHNDEATEILYNKYNPLIVKKCSPVFKRVRNKGIDFSDLMQECLIGFEESIINYNLDDDVTFYNEKGDSHEQCKRREKADGQPFSEPLRAASRQAGRHGVSILCGFPDSRSPGNQGHNP